MELPRCPITLDYMHDPVTDCNGHTFERSAIESWYARHDTSPVTGAFVKNKNLVVNYAIKQMIDSSITPNLNLASISIKPNIELQPLAPLEPPKLPEILTSTSIFTWEDKTYLHIQLECNNRQEFRRRPITCIAVIDTSGSMGERATEYVSGGENDGFSRLDLVKHSLATIYKSLAAGDKLAIITFNSAADLLLSPCDVTNNQIINGKIATMRPGGNTNIWAGLKMAIDIANNIDKIQSTVSILLLTDGVANTNPPRGIIPTFENYYIPGRYPIHTFAYGYEVDSRTLMEISKKSQGVFGFIPDGTMVGTIFINTMSAMLTTVYNDVNLEFGNDEYNLDKQTNSDTHKIVHVGSILHSQMRNILLEVDTRNMFTYFKVGYNGNCKATIEPISAARIIFNLEEVQPLLARLEIMELISKPIQTALQTNDLKIFISKYASSANNFIRDLLIDCYDHDPNKGQIGKAVSRSDWYVKWGCHYLPSLESAYRLEICLNFKDLALQHFAGALFTPLDI